MKNIVLLAIVLVGVLVASNSLFVVKETERAVMLQFGEIVDNDIAPGLHLSYPL